MSPLSLLERQEKPQLLCPEPLQQASHRGRESFLKLINLSLRPAFLILVANQSIRSFFHHRYKVQEYPPAFTCEHRLRMELHAFHKVLPMSNPHYLAIIQRSSGHLKACWECILISYK